MLARENRVILGSFALFALLIATAMIVEARLGIAIGPVVAFLLFAGVVVVPQLYLAITDDEVPPRYRVRFAFLATVAFAAMFASSGGRLERIALFAIAGGSLLALVGYEVTAYRGSGDGLDTPGN